MKLPDGLLRVGYVRAARGARMVARRVGLLRWLERHSDRRACLYTRSLFAIYDVCDLAVVGVPWWTFAAIDRIERFLTGNRSARIFEYGPGASTLWLAQRAATVAAVEHDREHLEAMRDLTAPYPNVQLIFEPPATTSPAAPRARAMSSRAAYCGMDFAAYVEAIRAAGSPFDLVVIDGRARAACLAEAVNHVAPGGLVLLDDSHRAEYKQALDAVDDAGWRREPLPGLTPCLPYSNETSLFQRDDTP